MQKPKTIEEFINKDFALRDGRIRISGTWQALHLAKPKWEGAKTYLYSVRAEQTNPIGKPYREGSATFEYSIGSAINVPKLSGLLECLIQDAQGYINSRAASLTEIGCYRAWTEDFGYDPDSIKGLQSYHELGDQTKRFLVMLDMHPQQFMDFTSELEF